MRNSEALTGAFQIRADQEGFPGPYDIFGERIPHFAAAFRQYSIVADLQLKPDFFRILERNIEMARVKNLAEFDLNRTQNFVLVQT